MGKTPEKHPENKKLPEKLFSWPKKLVKVIIPNLVIWTNSK
jgi:hypothetical protein